MKNIMLKFIVVLTCFNAYPQTKGVENEPYPTTSSKPFPSGKDVYGVFEGRGACQELAATLKKEVSPECFKTKWGLYLYQNPDTQAPTTYVLEGSFFRQDIRKGNWHIIKGTKEDSDDFVFALEAANQQTIYLLKGDDNVLFFLDNDKNILTGNEHFNYTLNRVQKKTVE
ncbi:hypothetical protein [Emticicia sp. C21]|uniref:hypothetical protein n=1 Tax=Emticicia sp. C21 TaxID=2302915 RepID=UPI000E3420F1|nr:hypothetical protein [Emticicia sp. C21]RFS16651.1 hypothetical protein D0T08_08175 [Emticicia sp. C21]